MDEEETLSPRDWSGKTLGRFMLFFGPISSIFDIVTFLFLYYILCPLLCGGTTYLNMLCTKDDVWNSSIGNVTFEKGARTNWHKHSGGQILLVTAGEGRYQERGKETQILKPGDVIKIPPEVEHWHGAAPDSMFAHISIETNIPDNTTTWLEPVSDKEYL